MRVVLQRVSSASVTIAGRVAGRIDRGLLILVGIESADTETDGEWLSQKIAKLRIFPDDQGNMNRSLLDLAAADRDSRPPEAAPQSTPSANPTAFPSSAIRPPSSDLCPPSSVFCPPSSAVRPLLLVISQFTLHASTQKGTRPSFNRAAPPAHAQPLYERFLAQLEAALGRPVERGVFGAMMEVALVNDGPVTLVIDSKARE